MKNIFLAVLICLSPLFLKAQGKHIPINLALWQPLSINRSTQDSVNLNLYGFYSNVHSLNGISFGPGAALIQRDMNGIQINGLFSGTKRNLSGINISGAINANGGTISGIAVAGMVNLGLSDLSGLQLAGAYNFAFGNMRGAQLALFFNVVGNNAKYFQFSTANNVGGSFTGLQFAEVFNFTAQTMRGMQFSLANIAGNLKGVQYGVGNVVLNSAKGIQFGLFNFALEQHGLQIGLLNSAKNQKGVPFGLINLAKENGNISWMTFSSNFNALNTGLKFIANNFFSTLDLGWYHWNSKSRAKSGINGFHYGYNFNVKPRIVIAPDVGFIGILQDIAEDVTQDVDPATYRFSFALQSRLIVEYEIVPDVKLILGLGFNRIYDLYKEQSIKKGKLMILAGFSLF